MNSIASGRIGLATLLLLFSKLSSYHLKALGFSLFLICTMLIIRGYFTMESNCAVRASVVLTKESLDLRHHSGLSKADDYFWTSGFFMALISENAAYLELSDCLIKTVHALMSV